MTPLAAVRAALTALAEAPAGEARERCIRQVFNEGDELVIETAKLRRWLDTADTWLRDHPNHPDLKQREDRWLEAFDRYMEYEAVLADALREVS